MINLEPKDAVTLIAGIISITGFYYALKRNVDKLNITVRNMDAHHKREISAIHHRIDEIKEDTTTAIVKIDHKMDKMQTDISNIKAVLSELSGYIRGKENK